ncbi:helix-turn-helix domain-containing protein [Nesterenkonia sphaerica]|uniref:Helix-turn-helix domain-containing protein n=1 Tax=Nesterenkonia sphaerica TaxID=1804988 RepID=A0A5R9AM31_9MICC|nr:helix-turn-helix domain-containing protein [Nesterenkonia sphaerica]
MAPLQRLKIRRISARVLSPEERIQLADLHQLGASIRTIATEVSRSPSTISRESCRTLRMDGTHRSFEAHR